MALRMEHAEAGSTDQDGYGSKRQSMSVDTDASAQRRAPEGETPDRDRMVERPAGLEDAVRAAVVERACKTASAATAFCRARASIGSSALRRT